MDIYLASDMISLAYEDAYDIAIIASGDGDYYALVELVKSKGKKVIVLSFESCLSQARDRRYRLIEKIPGMHKLK